MERERQFTLLLVDDNPTNVLLLVKIIEFDLPEVRVLTAFSAAEGLALAEQENIDGAFIDVQMPQMDGLEMCRQLRAKPRTATIPLVLMTAHVAAPKMRAEGLEVGAYDFISQPISNIEMLARIKVMLRLCQDEQRATEQSQQLQQQIQEHSERLRWISGLLISGNGSLAETDQQLLHHLATQLPDPANMDEKKFFEKLVTEFPLPWRQTLLKLSLLDSIPLPLAKKMSEIADVEAVFDYLSRHQLAFTEKLDGEGYLFLRQEIKNLLRQKAKEGLSEKERQQVCILAADWYLQRQDYAAALGLLVAEEQYTAVSQVFNQAGLLLLNHNYSLCIAPLVEKIPASVAVTCGWLSLFKGINALHRLLFDVDDWLELAYRKFQEINDPRGQLLTLSQQVYQPLFWGRSFNRELKRLKLFQLLFAEQLNDMEPVERLKVAFSLGLAELYFAGDLTAVEEILTINLAQAQQLQLSEQQMELNLLRSMYALQQGRFLVAHTALEHALSIRSACGYLLVDSLLYLVACSLLHDSGQLDGLQRQRQVLSSCCGHEMQKNTGISALLSYQTACQLLLQGEKQKALETVAVALLDGQTVNNLQMQSQLLQLRGWLKALSDQDPSALSDLETGLQLRRDVGGGIHYVENLLLAGSTYFALGQFERASQLLTEGLATSKKYKEERYRIGLHAWLAVARARCGDTAAAAEHVCCFYECLKRRRVPFFLGLTRELTDELLPLTKLNWQRIVLETLLQKHFLTSLDENYQQIPLLKVSCLGKFQLSLGQETFELNQVGVTSRQIFTLLIMAPNHSLSIESMMGRLWPESPQNKARNNFDTAHSRLRRAMEKHFGQNVKRHYLILEKGMLSLRHAQIDTVEFVAAIDSARYHLQRDNFWQVERALWGMEQLWGGEFLSGYDLDGELPLQRERLTQLRLEQLCLLAQLLQRRQQRDEAIKLLHKGLSIEPTHDGIISQLLLLYRQQQDSRAVGLLLDNYRIALQREEYEAEEIAELIEALGA
ncbi:transcriptional activator domain-containing protein [Desulfuromusa kysingii]|uniref:Transcriptional activator domain-containing protein n=1 Tax=Desulfuromusa kysingii TaxID=37625 RepID=A0A1H4DXY4_9BACT|nr:transcriptional activator domain-containing protein [Desulfuromusa kysingii]